MIFDGIITSWECIAMIVCISSIHLILSFPTFIADDYASATLLQSIYLAIIVGIFFFILFKMYAKFKDKDILDIAKYVGGNFLMYLTGIMLIIYLLISSTITLSEFTENINSVLFYNAPASYISLLFVIAILFGALIGLKGIFRTNAIITPLLILSFIFLFLSQYDNVDYTNFLPIFRYWRKKYFS